MAGGIWSGFHLNLQVSLTVLNAILSIWPHPGQCIPPSYGPDKIEVDLRGPYPDPKTIALRQKPSTVKGLDMAKVHPGINWKDSFGVFVYGMPKKK